MATELFDHPANKISAPEVRSFCIQQPLIATNFKEGSNRNLHDSANLPSLSVNGSRMQKAMLQKPDPGIDMPPTWLNLALDDSPDLSLILWYYRCCYGTGRIWERTHKGRPCCRISILLK